MDSAQSHEVNIRPFSQEDIISWADYWTKNSRDFWRVRGVDKSKFGSYPEFIAEYRKAFSETGSIQSLATIVYQDMAIGAHSLTDLVENNSAVFHAHLWNEKFRGRGIGVFSYLKAADYFMRTLNLQKIIFKTPTINIPANKVKEKIGIPCLGETILNAPILIAPLQAKLYELDQKMLARLKEKHQI